MKKQLGTNKEKSKRGWDGRINLLGVRLCNAHKDEKHLRELCFDLNL